MTESLDHTFVRIATDLAHVGAPFALCDPSSCDAPTGCTFDDCFFEGISLCDPSSPAADNMVRMHARLRGLPVSRFAGSLVFQRYAHRVCAVGVGALVRHSAVLDVSARNCAMRFEGGTPTALHLFHPTFHVVADPLDGVQLLVNRVIDEHLLPLAESVARVSRAGMPNLWGNMAAGFAGAFRSLSAHHHHPEELLPVAEAIASSRTKLHRGGHYLILRSANPAESRLQFERTSCCHWYAAKDGQYCSWCSKLSHDERMSKFRATTT